ncbi:MAG TPA: acyltransferase domain-containing protein [Steroidobacteraceae bacterium]|jgi:malonate decarboxylase epsilon subunit|nr:acyltransferase domain-containing protein [Steroidobacteraceae bacterium]
MRVALLFPGQGAQRPGLLGRLPATEAVCATLAEAQQVLGGALAGLDSEAALESTAAVQLATLIAGVAAARALLAEECPVHAVAGLSVGAFAAAVACAALSFADALRLVQLRGEAMARAAPRGHGMAAIRGLSERGARALVAEVNARRPLYLASVNSPTETVVAGDDAALALAAEAARAAGAVARRLKVAIPSHCPLMDEVSAQLRAAMATVRMRPPAVPYVSNHRARITGDAAQVAEDLILNVSRPVRWLDSVTLLYELGCRLYVEMPPGAVLTHLLAASLPEVRTLALAEAPLASAVTLAQAAARR